MAPVTLPPLKDALRDDLRLAVPLPDGQMGGREAVPRTLCSPSGWGPLSPVPDAASHRGQSLPRAGAGCPPPPPPRRSWASALQEGRWVTQNPHKLFPQMEERPSPGTGSQWGPSLKLSRGACLPSVRPAG